MVVDQYIRGNLGPWRQQLLQIQEIGREINDSGCAVPAVQLVADIFGTVEWES